MSEPAEPLLSGRCFVLHAFDVGRSIDLTRCRELLGPTERVPGARRRPGLGLYGLDEPPVIWTARSRELSVARHQVILQPRVTIYDFASISVALGFEVTATLRGWSELANDLAAAPGLEHVSREILRDVLGTIAAAVRAPAASDYAEPYLVFQLDAVPGGDALAWLDASAPAVAQLFRPDDTRLAAPEVAECLRLRLSYGPADVAVIDWSTALLVDPEYQDTLAVLDFANVELLALRLLDERLDDALESANELVRSPRRLWAAILRPYGASIRHLTELTADAAAEYEAVENAIQLTDDHYLARIYRLAVERFHLGVFNAGVSRKLETLWHIHGIFLERADSSRSEMLEWIVIVMIGLELAHLWL